MSEQEEAIDRLVEAILSIDNSFDGHIFRCNCGPRIKKALMEFVKTIQNKAD